MKGNPLKDQSNLHLAKQLRQAINYGIYQARFKCMNDFVLINKYWLIFKCNPFKYLAWQSEPDKEPKWGRNCLLRVCWLGQRWNKLGVGGIWKGKGECLANLAAVTTETQAEFFMLPKERNMVGRKKNKNQANYIRGYRHKTGRVLTKPYGKI